MRVTVRKLPVKSKKAKRTSSLTFFETFRPGILLAIKLARSKPIVSRIGLSQSTRIDASRRDGFRCRRSHSHSLSGPFLAPEFSSIFNEKTVHCPTDVPLIARRAKIRGQSSDEMVHRLVVAFLVRYRADNWHKVRQIRQTWTSSFCRARFHLTCRSIIHGFNYTEDGIRGTCLA